MESASRSRCASSSSSSSVCASPCTKAPLSSSSETVIAADQAAILASTMTMEGLLQNAYTTPSSESTLLDAQITLIDNPTSLPTLPLPLQPSLPQEIESNHGDGNNTNQEMSITKTVDDVWREIVAGRKDMKEETGEMMTLEDFLSKAGAVEEDNDEVKMLLPERLSGDYTFDYVTPNALQELDKVEGSIVGFGNGGEMVAGSGGGGGGGRGKRGRVAAVLEPLDKAAQQRQRRMIKNRESAARSRERKQAYQVELEDLAVRLEEENDQLLKEMEERTRERYKQLMDKVVPVGKIRRPRRGLQRVCSLEW